MGASCFVLSCTCSGNQVDFGRAPEPKLTTGYRSHRGHFLAVPLSVRVFALARIDWSTDPTLADRVRFGRFSHGEAKSQHRAMSWELYVALHLTVLVLSGLRSFPGDDAASGQCR